MSKIPVYFMPGLAASSAIFERIQLDEIVFEIHMLEWEIPLQRETLHSYAKRMASKIEEENVVVTPLVGCIAVLKTGACKGKACNKKVYNDAMCKLHYCIYLK